MLRLCVDSCIISALKTTFRKFCASESSLPNDGTEQGIPNRGQVILKYSSIEPLNLLIGRSAQVQQYIAIRSQSRSVAKVDSVGPPVRLACRP